MASAAERGQVLRAIITKKEKEKLTGGGGGDLLLLLPTLYVWQVAIIPRLGRPGSSLSLSLSLKQSAKETHL